MFPKFIQMGLYWYIRGVYIQEGKGVEGLIFGMLIGLHIWGGGAIFRRGSYIPGRVNGILHMKNSMCETLNLKLRLNLNEIMHIS